MRIIILYAITYLLNLIQFLILARCILSWIPLGYNNTLNGINNVLITLTEPVILPARKLLYKFEFTRNLPVDFSPWLAILILYFITSIISGVIRVI